MTIGRAKNTVWVITIKCAVTTIVMAAVVPTPIAR
jgi:hypothetical protein